MYIEIIYLLSYLAVWLGLLIVGGIFAHVMEQIKRRKHEKARQRIYNKVLNL